MIVVARDFGSNSFSGGNRFIEQEDADPRVGLVNLADVMLVFACGLMLALVVNWNIKLPNAQEINADQMREVDDVEEMQDVVEDASSSAYQELGTVYQDPVTGKLYMMTQSDDSSQPDSSYVPNEDASAASSAGSTGTGSTDAGASSASGAQGGE